MKIEKRGRYWAVYADNGELICVAVYKKGAQEVMKRIPVAFKKSVSTIKNGSWQNNVKQIGWRERDGLKGLIETMTAADVAQKLGLDHKTAEALRELAWAAIEAGVEEERV